MQYDLMILIGKDERWWIIDNPLVFPVVMPQSYAIDVDQPNKAWLASFAA